MNLYKFKMDFIKILYIVLTTLLLTVINVNSKNNNQNINNNKPGRGRGSMWWGLAKIGEPNNIAPLSTSMYMDPAVHVTLRRKQQRLVRENPGVLAALVKGANMAITECQHQFRNRRWNCSTRTFHRGKNLFGKIIDRGCRETAFIYAITSAAVTHSIARACSEGSIDTCTCDYSHQSRAPQANQLVGAVAGVRDWEWGGCSDNIGFGFKFSREFVDAGERGRNLREKMNIHNNEVGRWHVQSEMRQECKCHGMSGSCTVKTCWMRLPTFRVVGDNIKDRFDGATRVMVSNSLRPNSDNQANKHLPGTSIQLQTNNMPPKPNSISSNSINRRQNQRERKHNRYQFNLKPYNPDHKPPGVEDLVFLEPSPGFCEKNTRLGIQGTHGRQCNDTSIGVDGCDLMCCGRGYRTEEIYVNERCKCIFLWCCDVKCETCRVKKIVNTCL